MARKRIGELLLENGAISPSQLEAGLAAQRNTRQRLGMTLIQQSAINEEQLARVLSQALNLPLVELSQVQVEWSAVHVLRARFCEQHELFAWALRSDGEGPRARKQLSVAMADPLNVAALEEIEFTTGLKVLPHIATHSEIRAAILRYHHKVQPGESAGPVQIIQRGGAVVEIPRAPATQTQPGGTSGITPEILTTVAEAQEDEEEILLGEPITGEALFTDSPSQPGASNPDERNALAELMNAREAARREQRKGRGAGSLHATVASDLDYLFGGALETDPLEELEREFWALMRIMARKGLISSEEFMREVEGEPEER